MFVSFARLIQLIRFGVPGGWWIKPGGFTLLVLAGLLPLPAVACAICAPADGQNTVLYQLHVADAAALAVWEAGRGWRVVEMVKGQAPAKPIDAAGGPNAVQSMLPVNPAATAVQPGGGATLWLYNAAGQSWRALGPLSAARAAWARQMAALRPASLEPPTDWSARLTFFADDLEDPEPLVARAAYEEVAVAPYGVMRDLRRHWPLDRLRQWTTRPALAERLPLYLLLLGVAGDERDAARIQASLPAAADAAGVPSLSAAHAALIELRGVAAVEAIERRVLADPSRTSFEVQAAVMALGVHAADGRRLSRSRVIRAYEVLLQRNPGHAGFAASDLASWGEWRFGTRFAQILKSGSALAFASRYPMVFFLLRSPRPEDRAAVQALRLAGQL